MYNEINTEVDVEFEYKGVRLKFIDVPVTGSIEWGTATYWEPSWSEAKLHINMTPAEVQEQMVEMFSEDNQPLPLWDGQSILEEMNKHIESRVIG